MKFGPLLRLLAICISVSAQGATLTYEFDFNRTGGGIPSTPTGGFTYDTSLELFSAFQVQWDSFSLDLTARANALGATGAGYACGGAAPSKLFTFLTTGANDCSPSLNRNYAAYEVFPSGSAFILYSDTLTLNIDFAGIRQDNYTQLDSTQNSSGTFTTRLVSEVPEPSLAVPFAAMAIAFVFRSRKNKGREFGQLERL